MFFRIRHELMPRLYRLFKRRQLRLLLLRRLVQRLRLQCRLIALSPLHRTRWMPFLRSDEMVGSPNLVPATAAPNVATHSLAPSTPPIAISSTDATASLLVPPDVPLTLSMVTMDLRTITAILMNFSVLLTLHFPGITDVKQSQADLAVLHRHQYRAFVEDGTPHFCVRRSSLHAYSQSCTRSAMICLPAFSLIFYSGVGMLTLLFR